MTAETKLDAAERMTWRDKLIRMDTLHEIEARAEKATEGPWGPVEKCWNSLDIACMEGVIANVGRWFFGKAGTPEENIANGRFIAHARTDIPRMAAEIRQAWAEIERLEGEVVTLRRTLRVAATSYRQGQ